MGKILELIYGIIVEPKETLIKTSKEKPVTQAFIIYLVATIFTSMLIYGLELRNLQLETTLDWGVEFGDFLVKNLPSMFKVFTLFSVILGAVFLFIQAAVYSLMGEFLGGTGNGRGLFASLALTAIPGLVVEVITTALILIGLPELFSIIGSLVAVIWILILHLMAIRENLLLTTGKAIFILLLPLIVLLGSVLTFLIGILFLMS